MPKESKGLKLRKQVNLHGILASLGLQGRRTAIQLFLALLLALCESVSIGLLLPITNMMTEFVGATEGNLSVWLMVSFGWDRLV
jgi:hypothetical protein